METKLDKKVDKLIRQGRRQIDRTMSKVAKHGRTFIWSRRDHIRMARRDVIIWLSLVLVLIVASLTQTFIYNGQVTSWSPTKGGTYAEGVVDKLTTISPLYAKTDTEKAASQLVYAGLLFYDTANKLHGKLASSWSVDDSGKVWTVKLRDNIRWSNGQPVTADDVVFTVQLMKNPDINTTLSNAWETVSVKATNPKTIVFELTNPLTSFDSALTFGVLPKHILGGKKPLDISTMFSQKPKEIVGSGPYQLSKIEKNGENSIWHFQPSANYTGAHPQINNFVIRTYSSNTALTTGLKRGEINAISGAKIADLNQFEKQFNIIQVKTANGVFALFNNDREIVGDDKVREALRLGLDRSLIRQKITERNKNLQPPTDLETPIATGVYRSIDDLKQPDTDADKARKVLDDNGWKLSSGAKYRVKGDTELAIDMITIADTNYEVVANLIAQQWRELGVNVKVSAVNPNQAQQGFIIPRNYDVLVYQMHLGADPDMFAYWSSTQATATGLNLSNYKSRRAELALSAGRSNTNAQAREARYVSFVNQWLSDNPAIALYQPSIIYITARDIDAVHSGDSVIDASNRFANTESWSAKLSPVATTP